jgi:hypothetical protein
MKARFVENGIIVTLNGEDSFIKTKFDNAQQVVYYNAKDVCQFLKYKNYNRAIERLIRHDYIGTSWRNVEYVPCFLIVHLIEMSPCHYKTKILHLFDTRVFNRYDVEVNASTYNELTNKYNRFVILSDKMKQIQTLLNLKFEELDTNFNMIFVNTITGLEKDIEIINEHRDVALAEQKEYCIKNNIQEFSSDYESDYESTDESD